MLDTLRNLKNTTNRNKKAKGKEACRVSSRLDTPIVTVAVYMDVGRIGEGEVFVGSSLSPNLKNLREQFNLKFIMGVADQKYPPAPRFATHAIFSETDRDWNPTGKGATVLAKSIECLEGVVGTFYYVKYPTRGKRIPERLTEDYKWLLDHVVDYVYEPKKRGRPPKTKP